jgi:hypothetical protein
MEYWKKGVFCLLVPALVLLVCTGAVWASGSSALRFTQDNQCAKVLDDDSLDVTGDLTIEAWVCPEAGILDKWYDFILSKQMGGSGYTLLTSGTGSGERYHFEAGEAYVDADSSSAPVIGAWRHLAGVWKDGFLAIYVNGILDGVQESPIAPHPNEFPLWIGTSPFGTDTNWRGKIDEVRIWSVARTQEQILENKDRYLTGHEDGLRAYWSFDDGTGDVFLDKTANGNDGALGDPGNPSAGKPSWADGVSLLPPPPTVYETTFSPYWHGFQFPNWEGHCTGMSLTALAYWSAGLTTPRWTAPPGYSLDPEQSFVRFNIDLWTIAGNVATMPSIRALEKVPDALLPAYVFVHYLDLKTRLSLGLATTIGLTIGSLGLPESHMVVVYRLEEREGKSTIYFYDPSGPVTAPDGVGSALVIDTVTWQVERPGGSGYDRFLCYLSEASFFSPDSVMVTTDCPVDIELRDPAGQVVTKDLQPAGASYLEGDMDGDGDTEDGVLLELGALGSYVVHVTAEPDADPNATFSLRVLSQWGPAELAIGQPVSGLPKDYRFKLGTAGLVYDSSVFEAPVINTGFLLKDGTTVPVKFHLADCDGTVIAGQRNVTLEVTGPNAAGADTTYSFSLSDGTLRWDATVMPPHYAASFSTKTYSVRDGGHYTAVVEEEGVPIGTIGFDVSTSSGTARGNKPL